jgi:hypothetical protein
VKSVSVSLGRREIEGKKTDCTSIPRARRSVVICRKGERCGSKRAERAKWRAGRKRASLACDALAEFVAVIEESHSKEYRVCFEARGECESVE